MVDTAKRPTWHELLAREEYLILPVAHDALTAKLIQRAGFPAYQIGGFATVGARHGWPDIDLAPFGEESAAIRDIVTACDLPVMVDADNGYGDAKSVTHVVRSYESLGVSALFIEDQKSPKRCGHMAQKQIVPPKVMVERLRAALAARQSTSFFILARTDAIASEGLDSALRRAEAYLKAGADGVYLEGPTSEAQLRKIGRTFKGTPLATSVLEGGGKTPWVDPDALHAMGFTMILYPTTILFRVARVIEQTLANLRRGRKMAKGQAVDFDQYEQIVGLPSWAQIEQQFDGRE